MKSSNNLITTIFGIFILLLIFGIHYSNHDINKISKLVENGKIEASENFRFFIDDKEVLDEAYKKMGLIINDIKELKKTFKYSYDKKNERYNLSLDYHLFELNTSLTLANDKVILNTGTIKTNTKSYCEN